MNKASNDSSNPALPDSPSQDPSDTDPVEPADLDLVTRCQQGDTRAFDELVTKYRGRVYAMIYNMVKSEADAWDLSQEAFIKAWRALPKFEGRSSFYTWLYRISHNVTYDWLRKKKIQAEGEFDERVQNSVDPRARTVPSEVLRPDDKMRQGEIRERIEAAIEQLTPDHREVILLREIEGRQYQEIADLMECSIGTVMSRLFYARKKLQSLLKDVYETI